MNLSISINPKSLLNKYDLLFAKNEDVNAELIYESLDDPNNFISVIVPTYNRFDLLKEALASIYVSNKFNYIVIIVDNCSDILVSNAIKKYIIENNFKNLKLYRCNKHSNSWNMALSKCESIWVVMLHDDDLLNENYFEEIKFIANIKPEASLISVASEFLVQTKISFYHRCYNWLYQTALKLNNNAIYLVNKEDLLYYNFTPNTGIIFNREKAISIDGFHTDFSPIPDYVFAYKMNYYYGNVFFYNKMLAKLRLRENAGASEIQKIWVKEKLVEFRVAISQLNSNHGFFERFFIKLIKVSNSNDGSNIIKKSAKILAFIIEFLFMSYKFLFKKLNKVV